MLCINIGEKMLYFCLQLTGLILLVIASTVLGSYQNDKKKSRPITYRQYCRDGDSIDKLFPDPFPFTCKPGPGKNVVCQTLCKYM